MTARFGPAGNSRAFYAAGYSSSLDIARFLADIGLNAYEYQCGRGVRIKEDFCRRLGKEAREYDIALSIHSPYYINLATADPKVMDSSLNHISKSLQAAAAMGAGRIVVHPGAVGKGNTRADALARTEKLLRRAVDELMPGYAGINLCLETMGKINQVGSLEEILHLCKLDSCLIPTVDFGHLHARGIGAIKSGDDYKAILDCIDRELGAAVVEALHIHFSPIEYSRGGEVRHRTMAESGYGPPFEPLAELIARQGIRPVIICESDGTQTEDALTMQKIWRRHSRQGGN